MTTPKTPPSPLESSARAGTQNTASDTVKAAAQNIITVKSFSPQRSPQAAAAPRLPFVTVNGTTDSNRAVRILGAGHDLSWQTAPLSPAADTMFGPRGACLFGPEGPLWVADTGHHRLLGWHSLPIADNPPANWVIGQPNFVSEGQNAKGEPNPHTVAVPTGICACGEGMAVADAWNHRVSIWWQIPKDSNVPADIVLGQADFSQNLPNRGGEAAADTLHWPYGVMYHAGRLYIADTGNRRVLIWHQLPERSGQPADQVLGQAEFSTRNENGGGTPTAASMRWPHSLAIWQGNLVLADAGNNRLMIWDGLPQENNLPCQAVLGQANFQAVELNRGEYFPTDRSLNMPYGVAAAGDRLLTADTANSRLIGWQQQGPFVPTELHDRPADGLFGQDTYRQKGENRSYGSALRDSLCWPYGIQVCGQFAIVADSGNNRVAIWPLLITNNK